MSCLVFQVRQTAEPAYCNDIENDAGRYLKQQTTSLRKVFIKEKKKKKANKLEALEVSHENQLLITCGLFSFRSSILHSQRSAQDVIFC